MAITEQAFDRADSVILFKLALDRRRPLESVLANFADEETPCLDALRPLATGESAP